LLYFSKPLRVERVSLDTNGAPPRNAVRELSQRIEQAMREVILEAEHEEALSLIERAERIFSADEVNKPEAEQTLTRELELRRRFVQGYAFCRAHSPERIASLVDRITRFENELAQAGIDPSDLSLPPSAIQTILGLV